MKIGVLTSGGDAPGMNAAIRAIVKEADKHEIDVYGFLKGYNGLISGNFKKLDMDSVAGIVNLGGTVLQTARCEEFLTDLGPCKAKQTYDRLALDGLITIGGDGTFRGAVKLAELGVPCIGIPGTIDNDIASTGYTIGFDTAINTATKMIDFLMDSVKSHGRCMVVEVMGRESGKIALNTALATGADFVLLPNRDTEQEKQLIEKIKFKKEQGKEYFLIIVAEGYKNKNNIAEKIAAETKTSVRSSVLGYVQRGGAPSAKDRIIASKMGIRAVTILKNKGKNRMIGELSGKIVDLDLKEAMNNKNSNNADDEKVEQFINSI
ncbi:MAG: 6-phosphofructokinase [Oscillospiraceae bacterium]|nr:6-phosphofructokinase [Oscillospiraceae bacterium]